MLRFCLLFSLVTHVCKSLIAPILLALVLLGADWILRQAILLAIGSGAMVSRAVTIIDFLFVTLAVVIAVCGVLRVAVWEIRDTWGSFR